MPAVSKNQQIVAAIAQNNPQALYPRNRGMLKMKPDALNAFASTPRTGLPKKVKQASGAKPAAPSLKVPRIAKPLTPHTGFRSVMSGVMPKSPGIRWR